MTPPHRGAIFDLDGTLLDSLADLAVSTNLALAAEGLPTHPLASFRYFVGDGVESLLRRAAPEAPRERVLRLVDHMRAEYARRWHDASRPYPGIADLLAALAQRGVKMAVLSNKPDDFTRIIVRHYFPDVPFVRVRGQLPGGPKKPDPAGALEILAAFGLPPASVLYFGDTDTDMRTARGAGLAGVGVLWGFRPGEELRAAGAAELLSAPDDALRWF